MASVPVKFIIDSGADVNAITESAYLEIKNGSVSEIVKEKFSSTRYIQAYGGKNSLTVTASFFAKVVFDSIRPSGWEKFFVIKEAGNSLMSRKMATKYSVLDIGWKVPLVKYKQDGTDSGFDRVYSVKVNRTPGYIFPKFNLPAVSLNIDTSVRPRRNTYTNIPYAWQEAAQERIELMESDGIIEKVTAEMDKSHCSAMLAVPKGADDFRLVVDLRSTNQCIIREPHKMPTLESILAELHGSKWFSTIDLSNAFYHVEICKADRYVTNFFTGRGFYRYIRLPFGLCNAPDIFQFALETVLAGIKHVLIYLDDILIYAPDSQVHDKIMKEVLEALDKHNVEINHKKCATKQTSVKFLGFTLDSDGYKITQDRLEAIKNFRTPLSVAEVRSFLGMLIFVDKFMFDRAEKTKHLQNIIREKKFVWGREEQSEFEALRSEVLSEIKKLGYFKQGDETELIVDASAVGLGAVLVQYDSKKMPRIIGCASKVLSKSESKFPQVQREALAIVWAVERFQIMLRGQHFTVVTDNEGNEFIFGKIHRFGRRGVTRAEAWALRLQQFRFDIRHVPGDENIADVFSRLVSASQESEDFDEELPANVLFLEDDQVYGISTEDIARETETDVECLAVSRAIRDNDWSEVPTQLRKQRNLWHRDGGVLVYNEKLFVPSKLRDALLKMGHKSHFGVGSIKRTLRQYVFWPGISKQIEEMVAKCEICQRITDNERPIPFKSRDLPEGPWRIIQIDFLSIPLGSKELLMVCDTYSRMSWAIEMKKIDTTHTIKALASIFATWGYPEIIQSDNGPPFCAKEFSSHWTKRGIRHNKVVQLSPWMNGIVEGRNRGVIKVLKAAIQEGRDWRSALREHISFYNNVRPHTTTMATPFELMTGRLFRGVFPVAPSWKNDSKFNHQTVKENDSRSKEKSINYANKKNRARESDIKASDWVWVKDWKRVNKLSPTYLNKKFRVVERIGPKVTIRSEDGQVLHRWVSALKKTSQENNNIEIDDIVTIEDEGRTPSSLSKHQYKVLAEEGDMITVRNDSGVSITCNKSIAEKVSDYPYNNFTEPQRDDEETLEETTVPKDSSRPKREIKKPAWSKDYKLFNIFT